MASSTYHGLFGSWVRFQPSTKMNFLDFTHDELQKYSPFFPQEMKQLGYWQVCPYTRPTCYPAVSGGESVIRRTLGKLLDNILQVFKRTNTPLIVIPQQDPIMFRQYFVFALVLLSFSLKNRRTWVTQIQEHFEGKLFSALHDALRIFMYTIVLLLFITLYFPALLIVTGYTLGSNLMDKP